MKDLFSGVLDHIAANTRRKVFAIYIVLLLMNVAAWMWAFLAFRHYPVLLGTAFLAYSFGLRHAVDADHIAAIDNVTRKLMQEGKRPVAVGLMFSLGHSTIVVVGSIAISVTALSLQHRLDAARHIGGVVGTLVSTLFLFAIAIVNMIVLRSVYLAFRRVRRGERYVEEDFDLLLGSRGFLSRLFRPMFSLIPSELAYVSAWDSVRTWIRYGDGDWAAWYLGFGGCARAVAVVGFGFSCTVCSRHVTGRYNRQCINAWRVWMGFCEADSQDLLQHDDYFYLGNCRGDGWRD